MRKSKFVRDIKISQCGRKASPTKKRVQKSRIILEGSVLTNFMPTPLFPLLLDILK